MRFVKEWPNSVPSLLELAGRCIKKNAIPYGPEVIPNVLVNYLSKAQCCDNPRCNGMYFSSQYRSVKFVDFCGKYRVPLMQYLCSAMCASEDTTSGGVSSEEEDQAAHDKMKRVLLG